MSGPLPNTSTPFGRLLSDLDMTSGDLARAIGVHLDTANKWRQDRRRPSRARMEQIVGVLVARGADVRVARAAVEGIVGRRDEGECELVPVSRWGGGMPYDFYLALRLEEAA